MDQKRWYVKEAHLKKNLKIRTLDDEGYQILKRSQRGKNFISNIYNYDILTNYRYADPFLYTQMAMREKIDHKNSDYISRIIYVGEEEIDENYKFVHPVLQHPLKLQTRFTDFTSPGHGWSPSDGSPVSL